MELIMSKTMKLLWFVIPLGFLALHFGPGQLYLARDRAGSHVREAELAADEGRWDAAALAYDRALEILPEGDRETGRMLRLERARAQLKAGQMIEAQEGLVEVKPRSGTFVASVSAEDVRETFELRSALECMAVEKAARTIRKSDLQRLKTLLKKMRRPVKGEDGRKAHAEYNKEFHLILLRAAENRRLLDMHDGLNANIKIARIHASDGDWVERLDQERSEHEAIVTALEKGEAAAAVKAMRKHVARARDSLVAAVGFRGGKEPFSCHPGEVR